MPPSKPFAAGRKPESLLLRIITRLELRDGCWCWTGAVDTGGYGIISIDDRLHLVHRLMWELANNKPPASRLDIRHGCDNRRCCNPVHLSIGTRTDNMRDAVERDRHPHGESHGNAKLTEADVKDIRDLKQYDWTVTELAERYGVNPSTIKNILRHDNWRHV